MYHPGKVVRIFSGKNSDVKSADATTQALVEMWDEIVFTFLVDPHIADIKEGEVVLVDYSPLSTTNPAPKHLITKVLKGKTGDTTWSKYKKYYESSRKKTVQQKTLNVAQPEYFG